MKSRTLEVALLTLALIAAVVNCSDGPTRPRDARECGTIRGIGCPAGQTCELPAGECSTADLAGVCVQTPQACTEQYAPVCGCDGVTYGNDCLRLMAGAQKHHDGECA